MGGSATFQGVYTDGPFAAVTAGALATPDSTAPPRWWTLMVTAT